MKHACRFRHASFVVQLEVKLEKEESWDEAGFAKKMNTMPKYVVSSTLEEAEWENTTVLSGDLVTEVERLKQDVDGVILVAGSALTYERG
jgi:dihydrofolate reductase